MRRCRVPMIVRWDRGAPAGLAARGECWAGDKCPWGFLCRGWAYTRNCNDNVGEIRILPLSINVADRVLHLSDEMIVLTTPLFKHNVPLNRKLKPPNTIMLS